MKIVKTLLSMLAITGLFVMVDAFAQRGPGGRGSGGWGAGSPYGRTYNPKTVETIGGEVISVEKITPLKGMGQGVHLVLKAEKEAISVHLGPVWFLENQDVKIEPKDRIEVTGSRVTLEGKTVLIAAALKKGDATLKLRDQNGIPVWSGGRSR